MYGYSDDSDASDSSDEMDQRMSNGGFTNSEVFDLACQGVKPWDDDAHAVLGTRSACTAAAVLRAVVCMANRCSRVIGDAPRRWTGTS